MTIARKDSNTGEMSVGFGRLPGYLGYQIRQAQATIFRDFAKIMHDVGVTPGEFSLLTMVSANPGINQIALARVHQLDKSTLSYSVNGLVRRRLVRRTRNPKDRRHYALWLTKTGEETLRQATLRVEEQERRMADALKVGEREQLLALLSRITKTLNH